MIKLTTIDSDYIKFLKTYSSNVRDNKVRRPYIGVLFKVNGLEYFAPLGSPRPIHYKLKHLKTVNLIEEGKLGIINYNNMIPTTSKSLVHFDIEKIKDSKYKNLLRDQMKWIEENKEKIIKKASRVYFLYNSKKLSKGEYLSCNNFHLLEEKCKEWEQQRLKELVIKQLKDKYSKNKEKDLER